MKHFLSVLVLLALAISSQAQYTDIVYKKPTPASEHYTYTPAEYLKKASGSMITGIVMSAIGGVAIGYGVSISDDEVKTGKMITYERNQFKDYFVYGGSALCLLGTIYYIRGIVLIGTAGRAMEDQKAKTTSLILQPKVNGASLVLNF